MCIPWQQYSAVIVFDNFRFITTFDKFCHKFYAFYARNFQLHNCNGFEIELGKFDKVSVIIPNMN